MTFARLKTISHKTLAAFMAVWLSGAVFLLLCQKMNGQGTEAEFCPLARAEMSSHCDKAKAVTTDFSFVQGAGRTAVDCCGFLPAVFDKARKLEQTQKQWAIAPAAAIVKFRLPRLANTQPFAPVPSTYVPDRQGLFVKNCVFRI